jgi:hypothetical protein
LDMSSSSSSSSSGFFLFLTVFKCAAVRHSQLLHCQSGIIHSEAFKIEFA